MAYEDMLDCECDIYHILREDTSPGYRLPSSPVHKYPDIPDKSHVPCHFSYRQVNTATVSQGEPNARYDARIKAGFLIGTDIRLNDKVIDLANGYEYTAEIPRSIRGHHIAVFLRRTGAQAVI